MIIVPHRTSLQSIDCKPTISAYTSLIMPIDEYSTKIDEIIKESHWSKDPVLIVGYCVRKPTYFKETNSYDKNHSFCFSGPGDKEVVVYSEFVAMWRSFESSASEYAISSVYRYDQRFSAFVFVCHTYKDYVELCNSVMRHRLLYFLYENQLSICPFYILLPHPMPTSRLSSRLTCDFLSSEFKNKEKQSLHYSGVDSQIDSLPWYLLKEHGTAFLKSGDLKSALMNYKKSLQCLQDYCDKILQNETIQTLIAIFENILCLLTNVSKVFFDLSETLEKDTEKEEMVQESLDFAEHSVKMNPCWCKGYYRIEKASRYLGNNAEADKAITESKFISNYVEILKAKKKRSVIVENKMKKSPSWSLVKYKENVFLIDSEADKGHFSSLSEASEIVGRKQISFIVNPGKYLCNLQLLDGVDVDIVGNWNAIVCPEKKWLLKDSPVIIYNMSLLLS